MAAASEARLVISVKEARKILGKKYDHMSDDQIEEIIVLLDDIAKESIKQSMERIRNGEKLDMS